MNALKKVKRRFSIKDKHDRERRPFSLTKLDSILSCLRLVFFPPFTSPPQSERSCASPCPRPPPGSPCQPSPSLKDSHRLLTPSPQADYSADEADEETNQHLQKEIEEAEKHGHDQGKPGSFLNKLIAHGNKKTEEQLTREAREREQRYESKDGVIR